MFLIPIQDAPEYLLFNGKKAAVAGDRKGTLRAMSRMVSSCIS